MSDVQKKYPNDVRVVLKSYVVHPQIATVPALAACAAARQGKFAAFEHELWQRSWGGGQGLNKDAIAQPALEKLAGDVGLDLARFREDMNGDACKKPLAEGMQQLSAVGVNGTPMIFVNGKPYQGPRSAEGFGPMIDAEIVKANAAIAAGATLEGYYDGLMKTAKKSL